MRLTDCGHHRAYALLGKSSARPIKSFAPDDFKSDHDNELQQ
jgi:hypothetical protein